MDPAGRPPLAHPPALDQRHPGTSTAALPALSHRRIQGDQSETAGKQSSSPTTTRPHGTTATAGPHMNGSLRGSGGDTGGLQQDQTPASPTARPTLSHPRLARPGPTRLGQIHPVAPADAGSHQWEPGSPTMGGPPPHPPPPPPGPLPHPFWHAHLLAEQWCWE